jgi:hypothetical protein
MLILKRPLPVLETRPLAAETLLLAAPTRPLVGETQLQAVPISVPVPIVLLMFVEPPTFQTLKIAAATANARTVSAVGSLVLLVCSSTLQSKFATGQAIAIAKVTPVSQLLLELDPLSLQSQQLLLEVETAVLTHLVQLAQM